MRVLAIVALLAAGCGGKHGTSPPPADGFGVTWQPTSAQPALAARACPATDCFGMGDPGQALGSIAFWRSR